MSFYIKADRFLLENEEKSGGYVHVMNGVFGDFSEFVPAGSVVVDWSGFTIAPGLFDTHIHGLKGHDFMDGTTDAVKEISKHLLHLGVTRFLPTTLTSSKADLNQVIETITEAARNGLPGAQSEGIFLEGPYFTEKYKGAQNPIYFRDPNIEEYQKWQELANKSIVKIALAPERKNAIEFIKKICEDGVLVSIAHTDANYECCIHAIEAGARNFVHLFNGMSGLHHREPGTAGAALIDSRVYTELICDGFHIHPDIANLVSHIKGEKLVLITDCMRAGLMPDGTYYLGEFSVKMKKGIAKTDNDSLAGSTLTLLNGIKNLQLWSGEPLYKIWHKGSLSPAASLGKADLLGSIARGKAADYVVLDKNINVAATAVKGELKYIKE